MPSIAVSATQQTGASISAGTAAGTLRPQKRTFSLTGIMATAIMPGDVVGLWGSNDGGTTFQPLRAGNNQPVQLNFNNPEVVLDGDACTHYATQRLSVGTGSTLSAVGFNGEAASQPRLQAGTVTLVAGTATVSGVTLTTSSTIQLTMRDPGAGVLTTFIDLDAPVASRNVAAGTFVINAIDNAKATLATAIPTVDWAVIG